MLLTHYWPPFPALNYSTLRGEKKKADQRDQINSLNFPLKILHPCLFGKQFQADHAQMPPPLWSLPRCPRELGQSSGKFICEKTIDIYV